MLKKSQSSGYKLGVYGYTFTTEEENEAGIIVSIVIVAPCSGISSRCILILGGRVSWGVCDDVRNQSLINDEESMTGVEAVNRLLGSRKALAVNVPFVRAPEE